MDWRSELIARLAKEASWGYAPGGPTFSEPAALAAMALQAYGRPTEALACVEAVRRAQNQDGSVGIYEGQSEPGWPTAWAIIAWSQLRPARPELRRASQAAMQWLLALEGEVLAPNEISGHDVTLVGWPWVRGTHSWLEPTAMAILALRTVGQAAHPRVAEAERLLLDRQLPGGGCNYGNTLVFGQKLLAHTQPTGLALLALATESLANERATQQSVHYLEQAWSSITGVSSLCYAAMGLTAQGRPPVDLNEKCETTFRRCVARGRDSAYHLALLALAATRQKFFQGHPVEVTLT